MGNTKKKKGSEINYNINNRLSKDELIDIHTEAYYRAQKRIEQDKVQNNYRLTRKIEIKDMLKIIILLVIKPKHINKDKFADGLLMIITTMVLDAIGYSLKFVGGISSIVYVIMKYRLAFSNLHYFLFYLLLGVSFAAAGGIFLAASKELENKRDSNYLISYSSSLMGILAVILALAVILK